MKSPLRLIAVLALISVGLTVGAGAALWLRFRTPTPPPIAVPTYSEPTANAFPDLVKACAALAADSQALDDQYQLPWNVVAEGTAAALQRREQDLKALRAALGKPCLAPRPSPYDRQRYLGQMREAARVLIVEGRLREHGGHPDEALSSYLDALSLAPIAARNGGIIPMLVGSARVAIAAADLERCIGSGGASPEALQNTSARLEAAWKDRVPWAESLAIEWQMEDRRFDDMAQGRFVDPDDPTPAKDEPPQWFRALMGRALFSRERAQYQRFMAQAIARARRPYWQQGPKPTPPTGFLSAMLAPSLRTGSKAALRDAQLRGLCALTAIALYRKEHGALPATLAQVARYVRDPLTDPFDGKPLRYRRVKNDFVLYSVGPDMRDDGGTRRLDMETNRGDLIVWPWGNAYRTLARHRGAKRSGPAPMGAAPGPAAAGDFGGFHKIGG